MRKITIYCNGESRGQCDIDAENNFRSREGLNLSAEKHVQEEIEYRIMFAISKGLDCVSYHGLSFTWKVE